jgi:hypothetical protein
MAKTPIDPSKQQPWASGRGAYVFVYDGFEDDMRRASEKDQRKIKALLQSQYCEFGFVKSPKKWNPNEGTHSVEGMEYKLQAAKGHQCRVYGIVGSWNGKRAFFVGGVDPKKKRDKADQGILMRAANVAAAMIAQIKGASA